MKKWKEAIGCLLFIFSIIFIGYSIWGIWSEMKNIHAYEQKRYEYLKSKGYYWDPTRDLWVQENDSSRTVSKY